jgi:aminoglycoside phosphotransferase (APT) family kinase protein
MSMDRADVAAYLRSRLPELADLEVFGVKRSFPGMSRDTWLVRIGWTGEHGPEERGFVFRMDAPGGSVVPTPLRREFEVFRRLEETPVPVPRTYWYETDGGRLTGGREFFVRELVEGSTEVPHLFDAGPEGARLRSAVGRELVAKLAAIHTVDWRRLGFDEVFEVPPDETAATQFDLDVWEEILDRELLEPEPLLRRVFGWLRTNQPSPTRHVCLCKGNNGLSEEVWNGTTIVAMNDWELAHIGEPAEDWVSMELSRHLGQRGIDELYDETILLQWYEEASGIAIDRERLAYFDLARMAKSFVNLVVAARIVNGGEAPRASTAGLALSLYRHLGPFARRFGIVK